jgi:rubrerythrin
MTFNPFNEKSGKIEKCLKNWREMYPDAYDKETVDPYTRVRVILANGAEYEASWFTHHFHRHCVDNNIRRELSLMRRAEQQQQKLISNLKPLNESVLETTIGYEQVAVDLTAHLAAREPNGYVKKALDFALLEDFDHLYRFADLLEMDSGIRAEKIVGNYTEIMPGRPTIAEHRFPFDDVRRFVDFKKADPITKLNIAIITAAEQQTMNYYNNVAAFYHNDLGRKLFSEIAMIEEQHVTHYGSLSDPSATMLECLLNHEYTECYLYYSLMQDETDQKIRAIWERLLGDEISHLHKAKELLQKYENKDWQQVIPKGEFPELLKLNSNKDYVRQVLKTVWLTGEREDYADARKIGSDSNFAKYQKTVNKTDQIVPNHITINSYIKLNNQDYRYQDSPHPIKELQDRRADNTTVARPF